MKLGKNILFICGSINQTNMMHRISGFLEDYECYFSPYFSDGVIGYLADRSLLNFCILGGQFRKRTLEYLQFNNLQIDEGGKKNDYDLVFTCSDLIIPASIRSKRIILVQEGMTDPENIIYHLVRILKLPRWLASTSMTGLSHTYDKFCVASEGYKNLFIRKGVDPEKIVVTGIPNFDNVSEFTYNNFPYKDFVLVATSDTRETFRYENRKKFILRALQIANGKELIFKLHPNENHSKAIAEINKYAPEAKVFTYGNTEHMIANCSILITRFSSVAFVGLALGKQVYSEFDIQELKTLLPIINGGRSAYNISMVARKLLGFSDKNKIFEEYRKTI